MMGKQSAPEELFYRFRLADHVPSDHSLRALDKVLGSSEQEKFWLNTTVRGVGLRLTLN
jgi:hypothetical protein